MQDFLIQLLNVFSTFLEPDFAKHDPSTSASATDEVPDDNVDDLFTDVAQDAYKFMELTPPFTLEEVKQKYKRLSLRYHPDRNRNSSESVEQMQRLNHSMVILEREFSGEHEAQEEKKEEEPEAELQQKRNNEPCRGRNQKMKGKNRIPSPEEEIERKLYEEMKQELERIRKQNHEMRQEHQGPERSWTPHQWEVDTHEGRTRARKAFDEEDCQHQADDETEPRSGRYTRKNRTMDCLAAKKELLVALKLGLTDVAFDILENNIDQAVTLLSYEREEEAVRNAIRSHSRHTNIYVDMAAVHREALKDYLLQSLDEDGNTLLHYAAYFESGDVIQYVGSLAQKANILPEIVLKVNLYGQTPLDFAKIAEDPAILPLVQAQIDLANNPLDETRLFHKLNEFLHIFPNWWNT